jgi:hypothetical protein
MTTVVGSDVFCDSTLLYIYYSSHGGLGKPICASQTCKAKLHSVEPQGALQQ